MKEDPSGSFFMKITFSRPGSEPGSNRSPTNSSLPATGPVRQNRRERFCGASVASSPDDRPQVDRQDRGAGMRRANPLGDAICIKREAARSLFLCILLSQVPDENLGANHKTKIYSSPNSPVRPIRQERTGGASIASSPAFRRDRAQGCASQSPANL
jgi:hypothetical protein